jgi:hypothetical protein
MTEEIRHPKNGDEVKVVLKNARYYRLDEIGRHILIDSAGKYLFLQAADAKITVVEPAIKQNEEINYEQAVRLPDRSVLYHLPYGTPIHVRKGNLYMGSVRMSQTWERARFLVLYIPKQDDDNAVPF